MDMGTIGAKWLKKDGHSHRARRVRGDQRLHRQDARWMSMARSRTGCTSLRTRPTTTPPRSSPSAARPPAWAVPSATPSRAAPTCTRPCASRARPTPRCPWPIRIPGKLPQRKLVTTAAAGYSSYGNQIGLATGQVHELYHPGYAAKRMEIGAVVGATPADHVRRETPGAGRRGGACSAAARAATASAAPQALPRPISVESLETCGAEVQKGNAPVERKIQRLFRRRGRLPA